MIKDSIIVEFIYIHIYHYKKEIIYVYNKNIIKHIC